ncbi:MAG: hypothetical protein AB1295_03165 [Candidatus Micrarchaeota archaeon]
MQAHRPIPIGRLSPRPGRKRNLSTRAIGTLAALGLSAAIATGLHMHFKSIKECWKSRTPMCEGPQIYHIRKGHDDLRYGFTTEKTITVRKGGTFRLGGIEYSVLGHVRRERSGELIIQETDTEVLEIIQTYPGKGKFSDRLRFDGWTCEKTKSAKSE